MFGIVAVVYIQIYLLLQTLYICSRQIAQFHLFQSDDYKYFSTACKIQVFQKQKNERECEL